MNECLHVEYLSVCFISQDILEEIHLYNVLILQKGFMRLTYRVCTGQS